MDNMIGSRLKERRKELGITISQIHDQTGISTGVLSAWERSEKLPSAPSLVKLSEVLQCSVDWILFGEQRFQSSLNSEINILHPPVSSSLESELVSLYRELNLEDQEEVLEIIKLKLRKVKRDGEKMEKSYNLTGENDDTMIG